MAGRPKKVLKGQLSNTEKGRLLYLIETLGESEESYTKMAEDLGRSITAVRKYVKQIKSIFVQEKEQELTFVKPGIIKRVLLNLIGGGLTKASAQNKINRVIGPMSKEDQEQLTEAKLHSLCLRLTNAGDLMITSAMGGSEGLSVMTQAASERGDAINKDSTPSNPAVFKIFEE